MSVPRTTLTEIQPATVTLISCLTNKQNRKIRTARREAQMIGQTLRRTQDAQLVVG
jgi:hypothetical protein